MITVMEPVYDRRNEGHLLIAVIEPVLILISAQKTSRTRQKPGDASGTNMLEDTEHEQQEVRDVRLPSNIGESACGQTDRETSDKDHRSDQMQPDKSHCLDKGWLSNDSPLPDDNALADVFARKVVCNPTHESKCQTHEEQIKTWIGEGICLTTIRRALAEQYGFTGSYSSVRRLAQKHGYHEKPVSCVLDFEPGEAAQVDFGKGPDIQDVFTGKMHKT